jgi:flagellar biosynthesis/type III secretory pathway protein FliH
MNMLLEEWNWDEAKEVWREEALEEGREEGMKKGRNQILELVKQGYTPEQIEAKLTEESRNGL